MLLYSYCAARATAELQADMHKRARAAAQLARENRAIRLKHYTEVEIRREQQKEFDEAVARYNTAREEALRQYQAEVSKAKEEHLKVSRPADWDHLSDKSEKNR